MCKSLYNKYALNITGHILCYICCLVGYSNYLFTYLSKCVSKFDVVH